MDIVNVSHPGSVTICLHQNKKSIFTGCHKPERFFHLHKKKKSISLSFFFFYSTTKLHGNQVANLEGITVL